MAEAEAKVPAVEAAQEAVWEAMLAGRDPKVIDLQANLRTVAHARGFQYIPASDLADGPLSDILARLAAVENAAPPVRATVGDALMGVAEVRSVPVSRLFEHFSGLTLDQRRDYSADQLRRWSNARKKAVANWIKAVGDMPILDISRAQVLQFRAWWWARVSSGEVKAATANKDFTHLGAMITAVFTIEGVDAPNPFSRIHFRDDTNDGVPFSRKWVSETILAPDALLGLNDEARDILLALVNTGARPSELVDLRACRIVLDHNIPHIHIAPDTNRRLKTKHSERVIPLVGVSLEAFRRHPDGFPRYRGRAGGWSSLVTTYMRDHGLLESDRHSPYSLRHTFSDGLQNHDCPDRTRKELMGHVVPGVNYGEGAWLQTRLEWVSRIAF
ncbi:integrase [uncultured Tateyamaria sp.]|uniref:integrase n=1 Tax=uncultured Tateyamaria sp. TaxID=455651 RepID=UPI002622EBF2|nr:integrase [uncultured Tateyamaria sp.]